MTRDDPAAFAPPPAFGPFRVLHQIGIGALGPVFRTYEPTRDRLVAIKVFRLDVTPEQARTLADELARAAHAGLFHPSVVEPIAAGVEGTVAYRAEEYVAAESLDVAIRHYAPATLDKALPFLTQLAGAIDFARTAGVGHGALHLRDVFVTPDEARASGFGIVEALERTGLRAPVRRPYSAPERIAGEAWGTPADVFSLGVIAYELLTGRRPSGTGEQIAPLTGPNIGPHADVVRSVLARAMDEDPARRYPTALGFASALEVAASSGAVTDGGVGMSSRASTMPVPRPTIVPVPAATVGPSVLAQTRQSDSELTSAAAPRTSNDREDDAVASEPPLLRDEEEPVDDVSPERDEDAAHHEFLREVNAAPAPGLFDEAGDDDERLADLAMEAPFVGSKSSTRDYGGQAHAATAVADADALHTLRRSHMTEEPAADVDEEALHTHAERPRTAMLPLALALILGLLLGFAAGYATGGRRDTAPVAAQGSGGASTPTAASGTSAPASSAQAPPASGREFSEQAVAPPRAGAPPRGAEAPPVPGDGPSGATAPTAAPARSASSRPPSGRLVIRSTPAGAGVTVNGKWRGRTPLTMDALQFGVYAVRLVQPGYTVSRDDITLSADDPARTLSITMQRNRSASAPPARRATSAGARSGSAAAPEASRPAVNPSKYAGTIYVDSNPRGARVLIDGRLMGTTPASIPDIPIGSHVVRLELTDHKVWTSATRVSAGQQARVTGSLERIR
jgi:serine/threonine protein kinase